MELKVLLDGAELLEEGPEVLRIVLVVALVVVVAPAVVAAAVVPLLLMPLPLLPFSPDFFMLTACLRRMLNSMNSGIIGRGGEVFFFLFLSFVLFFFFFASFSFVLYFETSFVIGS